MNLKSRKKVLVSEFHLMKPCSTIPLDYILQLVYGFNAGANASRAVKLVRFAKILPLLRLLRLSRLIRYVNQWEEVLSTTSSECFLFDPF